MFLYFYIACSKLTINIMDYETKLYNYLNETNPLFYSISVVVSNVLYSYILTAYIYFSLKLMDVWLII